MRAGTTTPCQAAASLGRSRPDKKKYEVSTEQVQTWAGVGTSRVPRHARRKTQFGTNFRPSLDSFYIGDQCRIDPESIQNRSGLDQAGISQGEPRNAGLYVSDIGHVLRINVQVCQDDIPPERSSVAEARSASSPRQRAADGGLGGLTRPLAPRLWLPVIPGMSSQKARNQPHGTSDYIVLAAVHFDFAVAPNARNLKEISAGAMPRGMVCTPKH